MELGEDKNSSILSGLGLAFRKTRDTEKALYYYDESLKYSPKNAEFLV